MWHAGKLQGEGAGDALAQVLAWTVGSLAQPQYRCFCRLQAVLPRWQVRRRACCPDMQRGARAPRQPRNCQPPSLPRLLLAKHSVAVTGEWKGEALHKPSSSMPSKRRPATATCGRGEVWARACPRPQPPRQPPPAPGCCQTHRWHPCREAPPQLPRQHRHHPQLGHRKRQRQRLPANDPAIEAATPSLPLCAACTAGAARRARPPTMPARLPHPPLPSPSHGPSRKWQRLGRQAISGKRCCCG